MTKHEIIDFIAGHYNSGNRSFKGDGEDITCLYNGPDGKHCAFALMCLEPEKLEKFEEGNAASTLLQRHGESILKPEFRGHEVDFYMAMQMLHDKAYNWNESGLSEIGEARVKRLKEHWS